MAVIIAGQVMLDKFSCVKLNKVLEVGFYAKLNAPNISIHV